MGKVINARVCPACHKLSKMHDSQVNGIKTSVFECCGMVVVDIN